MPKRSMDVANVPRPTTLAQPLGGCACVATVSVEAGDLLPTSALEQYPTPNSLGSLAQRIM